MEPDSNSGDTGYPSPPPPNPNGRITVTIAAPPLERGVTLALPIQLPRVIATSNGAGTGGGGGWSEGIPILQSKQFESSGSGGGEFGGAGAEAGGGSGGGGFGEIGGGGSGGDGIGGSGGVIGDGGGGIGSGGGGIGSGSGGGGGIGGSGGGGGIGIGGGGGMIGRDGGGGIGVIRGGSGGGGGGIGGGGRTSGGVVVIGGGGGGGGGREDCWSEGATEVLIEAWGERYLELKRGNLRQNHWKEVADIVSSRDDYSKTPKTDNQCKNRIDTVKKKYKTEKQRTSLSGGRSSWRFFDRMEELVGPLPKPYGAVFATGYEGGRNVPVGIPVGVRTMPVVPQFREPEMLKRKMKMDPVNYDSGEERYERKKAKMMERESLSRGMKGSGNRKRSWGESVRELSRAIMDLGEAYQEAESMKLEQLMEMEKHRMKFVKDLELQRMKFMTQTQMEISHMKRKMKEQQSHKNSNL